MFIWQIPEQATRGKQYKNKNQNFHKLWFKTMLSSKMSMRIDNYIQNPLLFTTEYHINEKHVELFFFLGMGWLPSPHP